MGIELTHSWNNCSNFLNLKCWHNDAGCTCLHFVYGYPFAEMCEEQVFRAESLSLTGQFLSEPAPLQTKRGSQQSGLHWKAILGGLSVEPDPIFPRIWLWYTNTFSSRSSLLMPSHTAVVKHAKVQRVSSSTQKIWWIRTGSRSQDFDYLLWPLLCSSFGKTCGDKSFFVWVSVLSCMAHLCLKRYSKSRYVN